MGHCFVAGIEVTRGCRKFGADARMSLIWHTDWLRIDTIPPTSIIPGREGDIAKSISIQVSEIGGFRA